MSDELEKKVELGVNEEPAAIEKSDPIVELGERYMPGYFSPKDKVALIWSSAAVILGGAALVALAFMSDLKGETKAHQHEPLKEISIKADGSNIPVIIRDKADQIKAVKAFTTEIAGVNGWIIQEVNGGPEAQTLVYASNDGELVLIGGIVGRNDENVTNRHFDMFGTAKSVNSKKELAKEPVPEVKETPLEKHSLNTELLSKIIDKQPKVVVGAGDKEITVVIDPNCPYCHQYYLSLMADDEVKTTFKINFIPVGILGMDSVKKAALFDGLSNDEAQVLLKKMMFDQSYDNQITNEDAISDSMGRTQKWAEAGLNVVPMTIFNFDEPKKALATPGVLSLASLKSAAL